MYFASHDPERSMAFIFLVPSDPWIVPISKSFDLGEKSFAALVICLGTIQWAVVGWFVGAAFRKLWPFRSKLSIYDEKF